MLLEPWAHCPALPLCPFLIIDMVRTRGGSCLRPRVRFSTPEQGKQAPVPAVVPEPVPEKPQGFRRYQTRMGPRAPSPVPQRRSRRARPSKRAPYIRTGGVIVIQTSAIIVPVSSRGDLIAPVIAYLEDQATVVCWDPDSGERRTPCQRFSWRVVLRRAGTDRRPPVQGLHAPDYSLLPAAIHDAVTVLLSPGGVTVLPFHDFPGSAESAGAPIQY